jgi:hypothetical protein
MEVWGKGNGGRNYTTMPVVDFLRGNRMGGLRRSFVQLGLADGYWRGAGA